MARLRGTILELLILGKLWQIFHSSRTPPDLMGCGVRPSQLVGTQMSLWQLQVCDFPYDFLGGRYFPDLHNGFIPAYICHNTGLGSQPVPNQKDLVLGQALLKVFIEVAIQHAEELPDHLPEPKALANKLIRTLEVDGYEFVGRKLVPATLKGMNLEQEDDFLIGLIRALQPAKLDVILHHHEEAEDTFVNGNWGSASSETRNFFVAVLRGLREAATSRGGLPAFAFGNDKGLIEDYAKIGLLTDEEKEAVLKLWVRRVPASTKPEPEPEPEPAPTLRGPPGPRAPLRQPRRKEENKSVSRAPKFVCFLSQACSLVDAKGLEEASPTEHGRRWIDGAV